MKTILTAILLICTSSSYAQFNYEPSDKYPFGRANPKAPGQIQDYAAMIGICDCKSKARKADNTWADPVNMTWRFKYIMNGMAVQDETLKEDGRHSGSIRQYNEDSSRWFVHYYALIGQSNPLSYWEGNVTDDKNIVLYRKQNAPNGMEGYFRLTFYDMNDDGYKWIGEWVDLAETITFPTWKIECKKRNT